MTTAIITLDLINEICHTKGKLAKYADRIANKQIIGQINRLIDWGRQQPYLICHIRVGFSPHYKDASSISPLFSAAQKNRALTLNEWGTEFCQTLNRQADDVCITKHRVSAFYGTDLELILRANRIEHLILVGVATNNAVELTAREAHDRDYRVTVVADACETDSDPSQAASLTFLSRIATICTTNDILS